MPTLPADPFVSPSDEPSLQGLMHGWHLLRALRAEFEETGEWRPGLESLSDGDLVCVVLAAVVDGAQLRWRRDEGSEPDD